MFIATGSTTRGDGWRNPSKAVRRMLARLDSRGHVEVNNKRVDVATLQGFKRPGSQNRRKH